MNSHQNILVAATIALQIISGSLSKMAYAEDLEAVIFTHRIHKAHKADMQAPELWKYSQNEFQRPNGDGGGASSGSDEGSDDLLYTEPTDPICDTIGKLVTKALKVPGPVEAQAANAVSTNTKVVMIGEDHEDPVAQAHYADLISAFFEKGFSCLALEFPHDDFDFPSTPGWDEAVLKAQKLGMKILNIDQSESQWLDEGVSADGMNFRNRDMVARMDRLLASGECDKILVLNGSSHLLSNSVDGCLKSMPNLLNERGIANHSIIAASREHAFRDFGSASNRCNALKQGFAPYLITGKSNTDLFQRYNAWESTFYKLPMQPACMDQGDKSILIY